jgi:hypothetical protein
MFDSLLKGRSTINPAKAVLRDVLLDGLRDKPKKLQLIREIFPGMREAFQAALDSITEDGAKAVTANFETESTAFEINKNS